MPCLSRGVLKIQPNQCIMHLLLFVRSLFFLNFYYVFVLPRFEFPGTTNRPRVNRKYGIGFSCCYVLEVLLSCLSFHRHCYLAPILPTALQLVIEKQNSKQNGVILLFLKRLSGTDVGSNLQNGIFYCNNS